MGSGLLCPLPTASDTESLGMRQDPKTLGSLRSWELVPARTSREQQPAEKQLPFCRQQKLRVEEKIGLKIAGTPS